MALIVEKYIRQAWKAVIEADVAIIASGANVIEYNDNSETLGKATIAVKCDSVVPEYGQYPELRTGNVEFFIACYAAEDSGAQDLQGIIDALVGIVTNTSAATLKTASGNHINFDGYYVREIQTEPADDAQGYNTAKIVIEHHISY